MKKALGLAAIGTMAAGGFAYTAPSSDAVVTTVATCSGTKAIAGFKSTTVGDGVTDKDNQDVTVSSKGVATPAASTSFGSCSFTAGLSTPDSGKPIVKGYSGSKNIAKWGAKLYSPESDCNTADTGDLTEWPLNGKLSVTYTDLSNAGKQQKWDGYISIDGFTDPDNDPNTPSDVVEGHGIVTKGVAAGADIGFQSIFDPVIKDKTQTTETPYPGYNFDLAGALGCTTPAVGDANILGAVNGDGTSYLLALPATGITLTIGS